MMTLAATLGALGAPADERLRRFAAGDVAAFESLFRDFHSAIYGWIVRIVRDRGAAEDVTIETFWRIWRGRARFDPHRSFGAWARRIATNSAIAYLGRRSPVAGRREPAGERQTATGDLAAQLDAREKIIRAFEGLPPKLRTAATLAIVEELPYDEIADALAISVGAVKSRVFRATRMLRNKLERMGIDR